MYLLFHNVKKRISISFLPALSLDNKSGKLCSTNNLKKILNLKPLIAIDAISTTCRILSYARNDKYL